MLEKNWLGDKTGQGFYKKTRDKKNKSSKITFSLPNKIGSMSKQKGIYSMEIPERTIISAIKEVLDEFENK